MDMYDLLACPTCRVHVIKSHDSLTCSHCGQVFPILNGVPIMFPDGSVPSFDHHEQLQVHQSYNPWVYMTILQSLLDNQIVVEVGAGNMALDDPCIIRMDVTLTPYVDIVGDVHSLPFLPESIDYIFSLAVFEHLRNPFLAAQSIYEVLKDGGFIYHECNFVFPYHGYPHHYFNASQQGLEQVFAKFACLRKGVATYQMPSFALRSLVQTYLSQSQADRYEHGKQLTTRLRQLLEEDLMQYDIYFSEENALNVAAGTYFAGIKQETPTSTLVPSVIKHIWITDSEIHSRFSDINQLTTSNNILVWAKTDGQKDYPSIKRYFTELEPFAKKETTNWHRTKIHNFPLVEARFGAIGFDPNKSTTENAQIALQKQSSSLNVPAPPKQSLLQKVFSTLAADGLRGFLLKTFQFFARRFSR